MAASISFSYAVDLEPHSSTHESRERGVLVDQDARRMGVYILSAAPGRKREVVMPHTPLVTRIRGEYLEMPGLRLTLEQAQRLCGVERMLCKSVLDALVEAKFLCVKPNGTYARAIDGQDVPRPRSARAERGAGARVARAS